MIEGEEFDALGLTVVLTVPQVQVVGIRERQRASERGMLAERRPARIGEHRHRPAVEHRERFPDAAGECDPAQLYLLFTEIAYRPPIWLHLVLWLPATLIVCLALLRPMKGLMLAAQFKNKASEARHD